MSDIGHRLSARTLWTVGLTLLWSSVWTALLAWGAVHRDLGVAGTLRVVGDPALHFGELDRDEPVSFEMKVENIGAQQVEIARYWTSCGCTLMELPEDVIAPGAVLVIRGRLDTSQSGYKSSEIFVQPRGGRDVSVGVVSFTVRSGWTTGANPVSLTVPEGDGRYTAFPVYLTADSAVSDGQLELRSDLAGLELDFDLKRDLLTITPQVDRDRLPRGEYLHVVTIHSELRNAPDFRLGFEVKHDADAFRTEPRPLHVPLDFVGDRLAVPCRILHRDIPVKVNAVRSLDPETGIEYHPDSGLRLTLAEDRSMTRRVRVLFDTDAGPFIAHVLIPSQLQ